MTRFIDEKEDFIDYWEEFRSAIGAVLDRAADRDELYRNVICDQLFYVAVATLMDDARDGRPSSVRVWSTEMLELIEERFGSTKKILEKYRGREES